MSQDLRLRWMAPGAVLIMAGVVTVQMLSNGTGAANAQDADGNATPADQSTPTGVEVVKPQQRQLERLLEMPASLMPNESAELLAKTSGYVSTVNVDIGSRVRRGDALLSIDVPEMADELREAEATVLSRRARLQSHVAKVAQAESSVVTANADIARFEAERKLKKVTLDRQTRLRDANAVSEQSFDEMEGHLEIAEAELASAKARAAQTQAELFAARAEADVARAEVAIAEATVARWQTLMTYATLRAPFDGVITVRGVDPGAFVRSAADGGDTPILSIAIVDRLRVSLNIPEVDASFVRTGTPVSIVVPAVGGQPVQSVVARTAFALDAETRTLRAEVDIDNTDFRLAPGMYAQVSIRLEVREQAMMIPSEAIRVRGRAQSVLVAENGVARSKPVSTGFDDGVWVEVNGGLDLGDRVIVRAGGAIAAGAPIRAVEQQ